MYGDDRVKPNEAVAESSGIKSCFHSVAGTQSVIRLPACSLPSQNGSLQLGLCKDFTFSHLDPKISTKALLSMGGCQIIIAEEEQIQRTSYSAILLTLFFFFKNSFIEI